MQLIDSHCHFDDDQFSSDRIQALSRAQAVGVFKQIIPAVHANNWVSVQQVCQQYDGLYPAYGLHPLYLAQHQQSHLDQLVTWLTTAPSIAVGECGLDYFIKELEPSSQKDFFIIQLQVARQTNLPVIIHARRAVEDVIHCLRQVPGSRGVVHSFSGSLQQAKQLLDLGFYLSFGGPITYPHARRLHQLVQVLPLTSLLLETDSPDQPLATHRGQRNEPSYLPEVVHAMAHLRQQPVEEIAEQTTHNAITLFNLPT